MIRTAQEKHDFVASLGPNAIAELNLLGTIRTFERGHALFHEGQLPDRVLLLRKGVVKVTSTLSTGREVVLAFRGAGELVGDLAVLDGAPRSATIRAIEHVNALSIEAHAFCDFLKRRPDVSLVLLRMLAQRLRDADAKRIEFSSYTTIERVTARLLEFSERFGLEEASGAVRITLPLSQEELAGATGASLESVGRALHTMRDLQYIQTRRREIRIIDLRGLATLHAEA